MRDDIESRDPDAAEIEILSANADEEVTGAAGTVGGPAIPAPVSAEEVSDATDGSLAARMRAIGQQLQQAKTEDFPIPDTPLVLRARPLRDAKAIARGMRNEAFIIKSTVGLFLRDEDDDDQDLDDVVIDDAGGWDDGTADQPPVEDRDPDAGLTAIPGWGPDLARLLGMRADKATDLVRRVFDNPLRLQAFTVELVEWMAHGRRSDEQALGE